MSPSSSSCPFFLACARRPLKSSLACNRFPSCMVFLALFFSMERTAAASTSAIEAFTAKSIPASKSVRACSYHPIRFSMRPRSAIARKRRYSPSAFSFGSAERERMSDFFSTSAHRASDSLIAPTFAFSGAIRNQILRRAAGYPA